MEDYYIEFKEMKQRREAAVADCFIYNEFEEEEVYQGMQIERDRIFYSFIWDRYELQENDNAFAAAIVIDPTNKNINMKKEIRKLVKKEKDHVLKQAQMQQADEDIS